MIHRDSCQSIGFLAEAMYSNNSRVWLLSHDILKHSNSNKDTNDYTYISNPTSFLSTSQMIGMRLEYGDILGALRQGLPTVVEFAN